MKIGHLRKLLENYSDDCELLVELAVPGEPAKTTHVVPGKPTEANDEGHWYVHGHEPGTSLVRGETVANEYTHCGGGEPLRPATVIIEVTFNHFNLTVTRRTP